METGTLIGLGSLGLAIVVNGVGLVWKVSRVELSIRDDFDDKIAAARSERAEEFDAMRREFGETVSAIRTKVHEIETWSRDEFVRKASFEKAIERMEKGFESLGARIEARLGKLDEKIEKIPHS
jgi:hypothetical protein